VSLLFLTLFLCQCKRAQSPKGFEVFREKI
jgi:hypothetical protein